MCWFEAKDHCARIGGKLVEINSEEENTALMEEINNRRRGDSFWIGLTDLEKEGDWRLASNGLKPSYLNWHEDQPNNVGAKEHCARISSWKEMDKWFDTDCNSDKGYPGICEFDPRTGNLSTENIAKEGVQIKWSTRIITIEYF